MCWVVTLTERQNPKHLASSFLFAPGIMQLLNLLKMYGSLTSAKPKTGKEVSSSMISSKACCNCSMLFVWFSVGQVLALDLPRVSRGKVRLLSSFTIFEKKDKVFDKFPLILRKCLGLIRVGLYAMCRYNVPEIHPVF